jgi:integrase
LEGVVEDIDLSVGNQPSASESNAPPKPASPKLSNIVADYTGLMGKEGGWRGQTMNQNQTTYRMFIECVGDLPIGMCERSHLDAFYQLLRGLPALYGKSKQWRDLTPTEIAASTKSDASIPRLTMKTIKRHFAALGGLFEYARERGSYRDANPAHGFRFPQKGKANVKRQMWSGERLRQLFASPIWTGCLSSRQRHLPGGLIIKDEKYWLPLLGLYHGNRLEEFAQLRRSDVRCEGDIWYLDINDDSDDKQIKNEQSRRKVPIHPEIQRLGFLNYVSDIAPLPDDRLFPQLKAGGADAKYGHAFTKWWTRYRRDIGVYEKR